MTITSSEVRAFTLRQSLTISNKRPVHRSIRRRPNKEAGQHSFKRCRLWRICTFSPKLILLAEPDSHLHPNNQRLLCSLLNTVAIERDVQVGGLVHHSDRGTQYVSIKYTERLAESGVEPSVGSAGNSYDDALAETSTASTRPKSSIGVDHGDRSRQSSSPRWMGGLAQPSTAAGADRQHPASRS